MHLRRIVAAVAMLTFTTSASARDEAKDVHLDALKSCREINDPNERLLCYDNAVTSVLGAVDKGDIRIVDKMDVENARRGLFGFALPRIDIFRGGKTGDEVVELETLESTITAVRQVSDESWLIRIAEGNALWQISDAPMRFNAPKVGDAVSFKRASFGSYFIRVGTQIGVKGKRVN